MPKHDTRPTHPPSPAAIVGIEDLMARYRRGRSTIYELVRAPDFPGEVAPGRWRLDQIEARELRLSAAGPTTRRRATRPRSPRAAATPEGAFANDNPTEPGNADILGRRRSVQTRKDRT